MENILDLDLSIARKKRLLAGTQPIATFLMERAAEDLGYG